MLQYIQRQTANLCGSSNPFAKVATVLISMLAFWLFSGTPALAVANPPTITPGYGVFGSTRTATMSAQSGAIIYYTTNGSTPTTSSSIYTSGISVSTTTTLKAIAVVGADTSTVTTAYIQIDPLVQNVPTGGLQVWFKADNGVTTSGSNVTDWQDMGPSKNNAAQATSSAQPTLTTNAINGHPTVTFDGTDDFLQISANLSNFQGANVFIVTKPNNSSANARFFEFCNGSASNNIYMSQPNSTDVSFYCYSGSSSSNITSTSAVSTSQYQLVEGYQDNNGKGQILTDGVLGASGSLNNAAGATRNNNYIGRDQGNSVFFQGEIAEILIYRQTMTELDRYRVRGYLYARYALKVDAPRITPDFGIFSSAQNVTIEANPGATIYYTVDGSTPTTSSSVYSTPILVSTTKTVKAIAVQSFGTSAVAQSFVQIDSTTSLVSKSGLALWLKADNAVSTSGSDVTYWRDLSGRANDFEQTSSGARPTLSTGAVNGLPAIAFNGSAQFMQSVASITDNFTVTGSSIFVVTKPTAAATNARIVEFTNGATNNNVFLSQPSTNGLAFYTYNGSTASSLTDSSAVTIGSYQLLEALQGSSTGWIYKNGVLGATGTLNAPGNATRATNLIGRDYSNSVFFQGEIAEILVYSGALTTANRESLESYLYARYAIKVNAPKITPGYGTFATTQSVTMTSDPGASIYYTLDGSTPTTSSTLYTGAFSVATTKTIKAIAVQSFGSSTIATTRIQIDPYSSAVNRASTVLWLKADNGVTTSSTNVTNWQDMSPKAFDAAQTSSGAQPQYSSGAVNGLPTVTFNGSTQFLNVNPTTGAFATFFVVAKPTAVTANARMFEFGNGASSNKVMFTEPSNTGISFFSYNGSTPSSVSSSTAITLNQYQVITGNNFNTGNGALYVNGDQVASGALSNPESLARANNFIGRDYANSLFFQGEIAEIIAYPSTLSDADRKSVEAYLFARYGIKVNPPTINPGLGVFATTQSITMTADPGATIYYTVDGSTPTTSSTLYTGAFSVTSTKTVKAIAVQSFGNSPVASAFIEIDSTTANVPRTNMACWYKANNGVTTSGANVSQWLDVSGKGRHALQSNSSKQPDLVNNAANGHPSIEFNGTSDFFQLTPVDFNAMQNGLTMFVVTKPTAVAANARFIEFGNGNTANNNVWLSQPNSTDVSFYSYNGTTSGSITATNCVALNQYQGIEAQFSPSTVETIWVNGNSKTTGTLSLPFNTRTTDFIGTNTAQSIFFQGQIAEILVYESALSSTDRVKVEQYLQQRYQLGLTNPAISPGYGVFSSAQTVSMSADLGASIYYTTNGTTPTTSSTLYTGPFSVSSTTTLKAIAVQTYGSSGVSTSLIQIDATTANVSRTGLITWLKADNGTSLSSTNVTSWKDMSGTNDASQSTSASQPTFVSSAINGLPALSFNGTSKYLQFAPGFANLSPGFAAFIVTKPTAVTAGARFFELGLGANDNNFYISQPNNTDVSVFAYQNSTSSSLTASSAVTLSQYQLLQAFNSPGANNASIHTNATLGTTGTLSTLFDLTRTQNFIGRDAANSLFFNGEIAEIMLYNRPLSSLERKQVSGYLMARYALGVNAPLITPDESVYATSQNINMYGDPGASIYYTLDGSTPTTSSTLYTGQFTITSSKTIKAIAVQSFATSAVATTFIQIDSSTSLVPRSGLQLWLKADFGVTKTGTNVEAWRDVSGTIGNATQSNSTKQPTFVASATNSLPAISFDGSSDYLELPTTNPNWNSGASIFVVTKPISVTAGARFIEFGNGSPDNNFYLSQPSSTALSMYVYNMTTPSNVTSSTGMATGAYQLAEAIHSGSATGELLINGTTSAVNPVANINIVSRTGNFIGSDYAHAALLNGEIAEIIIYNRPVTKTERRGLEAYLLGRYGILVTPPTITPLPGVYASSKTVTISNLDPGVSTFYTTDGSTPTPSSTPYTAPFVVTHSTTVRAISTLTPAQSAVTSAYIQIDPRAASVPRSGMLLWLKADYGVEHSTSSVSKWADMSGNENDATQLTTTNQPAFSTNGPGNMPEVTFDGSTQFLRLPQLFSDLSAGIGVYAVIKPTNSSAGDILHYGNGSAANNIILSSNGSTGAFSVYNNSSSSSVSAAALTLSRSQIFAGLQNGTGSGTLRVNAVQVASGSLNNPSSSSRVLNTIGSDYTGSANFFQGGISELIFYNRQLNATELANLEAYLLSRYQLLSLVPTNPVISVGSSTLAAPIQIAISSAPNATVYFTSDGSTPSTSSTVYSGPIKINYSQTIKAIAVKNGVSSGVSSATYTLDAVRWPAPNPSDTTPLQIHIQLPSLSLPQ